MVNLTCNSFSGQQKKRVTFFRNEFDITTTIKEVDNSDKYLELFHILPKNIVLYRMKKYL